MSAELEYGNVADLVAQAAARFGDSPAMIDPDATVSTWADLEDSTAALAGGLHELGIQPGQRVGIMLGNGADFAVTYWGALRAGAIVVPINPAYTPRERNHITADAQVAVVIAAAGADADWPDDLRVLDPAAVRGRGVAQGGGSGSDCAVICYTSGTTGRPKGARLSHANLLSNLFAFANLPLLRLTPQDVLLGVLPFFHVFGLNVVLNGAAHHGACILAVDRFSPAGTAAAMQQHGVTIAYGAPPVFAALTALPHDVTLPRLRAGVSGADALPVTVWQRFKDRFGIELLEGYGLTETSPVLASNAAADRVRPGTVGPALPGVSLRVVDPTGGPVAAGGVGEIHAAGPNVFAGYHGMPSATEEVLRDGWFATGDLGSLDEDGVLTIVGRLKDMIIVSGFNVYPREVEFAIAEHPDVAEVVVVGIPDARTGERVRAVVVANPGSGLTIDALLDHCRTRLARYKLPRDVQLVDVLPRLATGKVQRSALVQ